MMTFVVKKELVATESDAILAVWSSVGHQWVISESLVTLQLVIVDYVLSQLMC